MAAAAIDLLCDIREATLTHAALLPSRKEVQPQWQGMAYQIGGVRLVSKMGEISEFLKLPRLARLPVVKPWVMGVANIRGRLLPVVDLHAYLDLPVTMPKRQWRVLIVENDDAAAGFVVEQSLGIQHFLNEGFEKDVAESLGGLRRYVSGSYRRGGRVFYRADLRKVFKDDRFFEVSDRIKESRITQ